jgi:hypothetical protein
MTDVNDFALQQHGSHGSRAHSFAPGLFWACSCGLD